MTLADVHSARQGRPLKVRAIPDARWAGRVAMECSYVGALLRGARLDGVEADHFLDADLRQIVAVARRLQDSDRPIDEAILLDALRQTGAAGGGKDWASVLSRVWDAPAVAANAPAYGLTIAAYGGLQRLRTVCGEVVAELDAPGGQSDPAAALESARSRLTKALEHVAAARPIEPLAVEEILAAAARPLEWVVEPLFTAKGVRIIGGLGKTRKSTLAIAFGLLGVRGGTLADHFRAGGGHSIAILDVENRPETWARKYVAVCRGLGLDGEDLVRRGRVLYFNRRTLPLDDGGTLAGVIERLKAAGVSEIVIDSLTAVHRQHENDAGEMRAFFQESIFRLRDEVGAGVTVLHHHRKPPLGADDPSQALRGSSDLRNVVDTHVAISRDARDRSVLRLDVTAQRDAEEAGPFYVRTLWPEGGPMTFSPVEPGDVAMPKVEACQGEIVTFLEGLTGRAAGRQTIITVISGKGFSERTISDALSRLAAGAVPRLRKDAEGRQTIYRVTP